MIVRNGPGERELEDDAPTDQVPVFDLTGQFERVGSDLRRLEKKRPYRVEDKGEPPRSVADSMLLLNTLERMANQTGELAKQVAQHATAINDRPTNAKLADLAEAQRKGLESIRAWTLTGLGLGFTVLALLMGFLKK